MSLQPAIDDSERVDIVDDSLLDGHQRVFELEVGGVPVDADLQDLFDEQAVRTIEACQRNRAFAHEHCTGPPPFLLHPRQVSAVGICVDLTDSQEVSEEILRNQVAACEARESVRKVQTTDAILLSKRQDAGLLESKRPRQEVDEWRLVGRPVGRELFALVRTVARDEGTIGEFVAVSSTRTPKSVRRPHPLDHLPELLELKRLSKERIDEIIALMLVFTVGPQHLHECRDQNDRQVAPWLALGTQFTTDLVAHSIGQRVVDDEEVGASRMPLLEPLVTIGGLVDLQPLLAKEVGEGAEQPLIVFDDQYALGTRVQGHRVWRYEGSAIISRRWGSVEQPAVRSIVSAGVRTDRSRTYR